MKKRIFSLLLALAMVLSLMPAGALAADDDVFYLDEIDANGKIVTSSTWNRTGPKLASSGSVTLSGQYYIVQNDVTIDGDLTVDGSKEGGLVLCKGATLTVTGALIHTGGSAFFIYGQTAKGNSQSTGKLIIQNSGSTGAAIRAADGANNPQLSISSGKVTIYGGSSGKLVEGVQLYSTSSVHKATTLGGEAIALEAWKGKTSLSGSSLVLEYCDHIDADTVWIKDDDTQHHWECSTCGFVSSQKEDHSVTFPVSWNETTHTLRCEDCDYMADPAKHNFIDLSSPVVSSDGKGHVSQICEDCGYTSATAEPHTYNSMGACSKCLFLPVFEDNNGNLYAYDGSDSILELNEAIEKGATSFKLVNLATGEGADTTTVNACFSLETDAAVTLDMNGKTLESNSTPITVEAGTLIITGAAAIQNTGRNELAAPAILVKGGTLTFNDTVTATGGSGSNPRHQGHRRQGGLSRQGHRHRRLAGRKQKRHDLPARD